MKHDPPITLLLILLFITAQLLGLGLLTASMNTIQDEQGNTQLSYDDTAIGERPDTTPTQSILLILLGIAIGTTALLIIIKFKLVRFWKLWFLLAVILATTISLGVILNHTLAFIIAAILGIWKIYRPNPYIHNLTEVLVYTGLAVLIVPIIDLVGAITILAAIALYDIIAVWKSKHMISMANFQTQSKVFAGLLLPYKQGSTTIKKPTNKTTKTPTKDTGVRTAILGGGDIAFPLLFSGATAQWLVTQGYTTLAAFSYTLIVIAGSTAALTGLFLYAKKDRFYPAMPPLALGCFVGFAIIAAII